MSGAESNEGSPNRTLSSVGPSEAVVEALGASELFRSFTRTGLQIFAGIAQQKIMPAGTPIFVENMLGDGLFVVVDGRVRIEARDSKGQTHTLLHLGPGDSLGEVTLLRAGPRMCSATAETDVHVLEISRRDVSNLLRTKPQACVKLMMSVADILGNRLKSCEPDLKRLIG